jgi:hypothetical protein
LTNATANATTGPVTFTVQKPSPSTGIVLSIAPQSGWTVTESLTSFSITRNEIITGNAVSNIDIVLTRNGGSSGLYSFTAVIASGSGGDSNNANNVAIATFYKN